MQLLKLQAKAEGKLSLKSNENVRCGKKKTCTPKHKVPALMIAMQDISHLKLHIQRKKNDATEHMVRNPGHSVLHAVSNQNCR